MGCDHCKYNVQQTVTEQSVNIPSRDLNPTDDEILAMRMGKVDIKLQTIEPGKQQPKLSSIRDDMVLRRAAITKLSG